MNNIKIEYAKNLHFNRDGKIDCVIKLSTFDSEMPYTASSNDSEPLGRWIFEELETEKYGAISPYTKTMTIADRIADNQKIIAALVQKADDIIRPLSEERDADIISNTDLFKWKSWIGYRKTLRNLDTTSPEIEWPTPPEHS